MVDLKPFRQGMECFCSRSSDSESMKIYMFQCLGSLLISFRGTGV